MMTRSTQRFSAGLQRFRGPRKTDSGFLIAGSGSGCFPRPRQNHKQRGIALVLVLWVVVLLSVVVGSFTLAARVETLQARNLVDATRAYFAAEAGVNLAVAALQRTDADRRWVADGRPYTLQYGDAEVEVRVVDASGRIDLNAAPREPLMALFESVGVKSEEAEYLVDSILDWRDPDDLTRMFGAEDSDYDSLGYPYGAKDAQFDSVEELLRVMGMNYELFRQVESALTAYSGRSEVNVSMAPRAVLLTLPGMTPQNVDRYLEQRRIASEQGLPPPLLPNGIPPGGGAASLTYSVEVEAELPNGASAGLEAVVRMHPDPAGRPFSVVSWKENEFTSDKYSAGEPGTEEDDENL